MRVTLDVSIGKSVTIKATARTTPAGLAAAALLVAAILMPVIYLNRARAGTVPLRGLERGRDG